MKGCIIRNFILILLPAILCSCAGQAVKQPQPAHTAPDTLVPGSEAERIYAGTIPSASGRTDYRLTLRNRKHSGDGTYSLIISSPGTKADRETALVMKGKWGTLRGTEDDPDATVYQLNIGDPARYVDFLYLKDSLIMLNDARQRFRPASDYTLRLNAKRP